MSLTIQTGLRKTAYSRVRSHYCLTRELLPAVFPPWAGSLLFNQPGELKLLCVHHIDAKLSTDIRSTQDDHPQESRPQAIQQPQPPSHWITGVRHYARLTNYEQIYKDNCNKPRVHAGSKKTPIFKTKCRSCLIFSGFFSFKL